MKDTSSDNVCNFTTRYTYGNSEQEYVFSCRGRPFAALVSQNLSIPTPTSSLFDYDLIKSLGLKLTDLQCKKFFYAGNKFRILGRISTTVQCVQNGRSGSNFHVKGLVIADLNKVLDTHCVAGHKMQQQLSSLCDKVGVVSDDDDDNVDDLYHDQDHRHNNEEGGVFNERKCKTVEKEEYQNVPRVGLVNVTSTSKSATQPLDPRLVAAVDCGTQPLIPSLVGINSGDELVSSDTDSEDHCDPANPAWAKPVHSRTTIGRSVTHTLKHSSSANYYDLWSKQALTQAEVKTIKKSQVDAKPRIVNLNADKGRHNMLRVGVWTNLDDPMEHQIRHIVAAEGRIARPEHVCEVCSYLLHTTFSMTAMRHVQHSCPLSNTTGIKHCAMCCEEVSAKVKKRSSKRNENKKKLCLLLFNVISNMLQIIFSRRRKEGEERWSRENRTQPAFSCKADNSLCRTHN